MTIIAFSGKGGTGKTTITTLTAKYFSEKNQITLAFDMDPDAHLYRLLGLPLRKTMGQIVDYVHEEKKFELEPKKPVDLSNQEFFYSLVMSNVLIEGENIDLITLGKPSSEIDCYCPVYYWAEYVISRILKSYKKPYENIVIDCDPGTEIFPRKILDTIADKCGIDYVFTILDASLMSLDTARDISKEIEKKQSKFGKIYAIGNRVDDPNMQELIKKTARDSYNIELIGFVPTDTEISKMNLTGENILTMLGNYPSFKSMKKILELLYI